jgi:polyisoprenoid-binding protein YceI
VKAAMIDVPLHAPRRRGGAAFALAIGLAALAPAAACLAASRWSIDPARTRIAFTVDAVGYPRTHGEFRKFDGAIAVDIEHPARSRVSFHVEAQSVDVGSSSFNDASRPSIFPRPRWKSSTIGTCG